MKIDTENKKRIEYYFVNYRLLKSGIETGADKVALKGGRSAYAPITPDDSRWLEVVEQTVKKFESTPKNRLIDKRFFRREKEVKIFTDLYIDRSTYYLWQHEVYEYAYVVAVSKQLLKVD